MTNHNESNLGDAIRQMLAERGLAQQLAETKIKLNWEEWMGKTIARYTEDIRLKEKKLLLKIRSGPLRNELLYLQHNILEKINDQMGDQVVTEIVFI